MRILSNEEMLTGVHTIGNCSTYSVETESNGYADDLFNGTFEECVQYISSHKPDEKGHVQIAYISLLPDGYTDYTHEIIQNW